MKEDEKEFDRAVGNILGFFLESFIVMLIWNGMMPYLFGFKSIDYFGAMGIYILCNLMFNHKSVESKGE